MVSNWMMRTAIFFLSVAVFFSQTADYSPDKENVVLKTQPGKQMFKEDVQCGDYFWKSEKADRNGVPVLYYFYGDPAWGKNKVGLYRQSVYRVTVNAKKDPPTVQVIMDAKGALKEVRVQMTDAQRNASKACFPE